jgi:hypothetical protein
MPKEWEDIEGTYGHRYTKWQLLEWSIVPVPSNPKAVRTLKSLGLNAGASGRKRIDNQPDADRLDGLLTELKAWRRKSGRVCPLPTSRPSGTPSPRDAEVLVQGRPACERGAVQRVSRCSALLMRGRLRRSRCSVYWWITCRR